MTIRKTPEDFRVDEVLTPAWAERARGDMSGPLLLVRVTKTSLTTAEASERVARALGVRAAAVEHAGMKDKHAVTLQHVTVRPGPQRPSAGPIAVGDTRVEAEVVGSSPVPIDARAIARNRFVIVVRDLTRDEVREMDRRAALLTAGGSLWFTNFFGDQRFGSARHGQGFAAVHLIRGEFESALKLLIATPARKDSGPRRLLTRAAAGHWADWPAILAKAPRTPERRAIEVLAAGGSFKDAFATLPYLTQQLAVDAHQSHLWNRAAGRAVAALAASPAEILHTPDEFGELAFLSAAISTPLRHLSIPLPAPELTRQTHDPRATSALQSVLDEESLALDRLTIPGLRRPAYTSAARRVLVEASAFELAPPEPDELASSRSPRNLKRVVRFDLPSGSYATVLLRALGQ